jgi:F420-0:gamma-glutamyl ligase-like protein
MELPPNPGKKLNIKTEKGEYDRYPVRTHFITQKDKIEEIIERYVISFAEKNDIIVLGQKIVSISQGKIVSKKDVKVGFWAKFLSKFAKKTPYGFSVGNPLKMQLAIDLAGLPRILMAGFLGSLAKIFGIRGVFYRLAGNQINQLDGFYGEAFPQYAEIGILGFKDADNLCNQLKKKYGFSFVVADVNDLGGNILGRSSDLNGEDKFLLETLKDNPTGQSNEQTPIIILRERNRHFPKCLEKF